MKLSSQSQTHFLKFISLISIIIAEIDSFSENRRQVLESNHQQNAENVGGSRSIISLLHPEIESQRSPGGIGQSNSGNPNNLYNYTDNRFVRSPSNQNDIGTNGTILNYSKLNSTSKIFPGVPDLARLGSSDLKYYEDLLRESLMKNAQNAQNSSTSPNMNISSDSSTITSTATSMPETVPVTDKPDNLSVASSSSSTTPAAYIPVHDLIKIPPQYNKWVPPYVIHPVTKMGIPLEVEIFMNIRDVREIDEVNERVTLEMKLTMLWQDLALFYDQYGNTSNLGGGVFIVLSPEYLKQVWIPDIYIAGLVTLNQPKILSVNQEGFQVNRDLALLSYSVQTVISVYCPMDFKYYPADTQRCPVHIQSYSYRTESFHLNWMTAPGVYLEADSDSNFEVAVESVEKKIIYPINFAKVGQFGHESLQFEIVGRRKLSFHLIQTYLPSLFFICITALCFFLPPAMVEARIGIAMTTLLTLTTMYSGIRESGPVVSHIKALDIWMIFCVLFVFLTLLEFAVLCWVTIMRRRRQASKDEESQGHSNPTFAPGDDIELTQGTGSQDGGQSPPPSLVIEAESEAIVIHKLLNIIDFIERRAFVITFTTFIVFVVGYWGWLLTVSKYLHFSVDPTYNHID